MIEGAQFKSINVWCVQTLPVDDIFLKLKEFRVVGEFYFQGFFCPVEYVINKISLVSFP